LGNFNITQHNISPRYFSVAVAPAQALSGKPVAICAKRTRSVPTHHAALFKLATAKYESALVVTTMMSIN